MVSANEVSQLLEQALAQLEQVNSFCKFCTVLEMEDVERRLRVHPAYVGMHVYGLPHLAPGVPIPPEVTQPDPLTRRTLDPDIWHGLGVVGVWSAIDAYRERKNPPNSQTVTTALVNDPRLSTVWGELDDLRHLFAHNFAGRADYRYWQRQRHRFSQDVTTPLSTGTGTCFAHNMVRLTGDDLQIYVAEGRSILTSLDAAWP